MTPEIKRENIASDEDILELLSILLEVELNKPVHYDVSNNIQEYFISPNNRRLNGSTLKPVQEFGPRQNNQKIFHATSGNQGNFSLYNEKKPEDLLKNKDTYMMILKKLYREAVKLTKPNRKYYENDSIKIIKLLEIINYIKTKLNKERRFNFNEGMYQSLKNKLNYL